jgi:4-hydroxy-3-polyprenylbenzoate decarboxylase
MGKTAFKDLREFIAKLEEEGELVRIKQEVDWNLEVGAIIRRANEKGSPASLFENIKGYPEGYRIIGGLAATRGRLALDLCLPKNTSHSKMMDSWDEGFSHPIKPKIVRTGSCKENVLTGNDINLYKFPIPMVHDGDGGRYLTWHLQAFKDPDSDWINWGMYRMMIHNRNHFAGMIMPFQHGASMFRKYEEANMPMDFAVALGGDPLCSTIATSAVPYGVDEADIIGGLRGEPLEVVKCETNDLIVPAESEIVFEGQVLPKVRVDEGPFGEFTGYRASPRAPRLVYKVNCITYRNNPIAPATCMGIPYDEVAWVDSLNVSAALRRSLKQEGLPIVDVYCAPESSFLVIVTTKTPYPGIAHKIASVIWGTSVGTVRCKIMVMNDDIDATNLGEVVHAFASKCHPIRGTHVVAEAAGHPLIPFQALEERLWSKSCNVLYDCTWPLDWPPEIAVPPRSAFNSIYPEHIQEKVINNWKNYGFGEDS